MTEAVETSRLEEDQFLKLPEEVIIDIFKYVDIPSRASIVTVCRKFYELLCYLETDKHPLKLSYQQVKLIQLSIRN